MGKVWPEGQSTLVNHVEGKEKCAKGSSCNNAHAVACHALDQSQGRQRHAEGNDAAIVDERSKSWNSKLLAQKENGCDAGPCQKEELGWKGDAHEKLQAQKLFLGKARCHKSREGGRKDHGNDCERNGCQGHPGEHRGKEFPAVSLVLLKAPCQQGHEGDAQKSPCQKVVEDVRDNKGRKVDVGFAPCAKLPGNDLVAHKTHEP